jgi:hypothetical protein
MKKSVILGIMGLAVATVSSYGQGSIAFDTYDAQAGAGIITTFGNGPSVGSPIGTSFTGELLYSVAPITDAATTAGTAGAPLNGGWSVGSTAFFATPSNIQPGYIQGPNFTFGGVGSTLYFEIVAFNGATYGSSTYSGHSASFTATLVTGTTLPNADQLDNLAAFSVFQAVPEPTTMALGGLGLAALLVARRKKA